MDTLQALHEAHKERLARFSAQASAAKLAKLAKLFSDFKPKPIEAPAVDWATRQVARWSSGSSLTITKLQLIVADEYGVTRADILSASRLKKYVTPRQVSMYLTREIFHWSMAKIGQNHGNRDHTTIIFALRKIEDLLKTDNALACRVEIIRGRLEA